MDTCSKPSFLLLCLASHCKMKGLPLLRRAEVFHRSKHCFSWVWTLIVNSMLLYQGKIMEVTSLLTAVFAVLMVLGSQRGSETKEGF